MHTLVVKYTPRGSRSRTNELLHHFLEHLPIEHDVRTLDLCHDLPDFFLPDRLQSYIIRNYHNSRLDLHHAKLMHQMDKMTADVLGADQLVLATPIHNYSLPALVKGWFDSIMLKGKTWDLEQSPAGEITFSGLIPPNRKALVIVTSGSTYQADSKYKDFCTPLAKQNLDFMGFSPVQIVHAAGMNFSQEVADRAIDHAKSALAQCADNWLSHKVLS